MTKRAGTIEAVANPWMDNWPRAVLIVLLTLLVYVPAITGGFVWDDDFYVTGNSTLRSVEGLKRIWTEPGAVPQYYPLVHTGFWFEYHLWGLDPYGYHLVNVLLHTFGAVLLWLLLRRLSLPGAWFAAMIFALHPINVESVAWITERKNVLSGLFYFASMLAYLRWAGIGESAGTGPADVPRRRPHAGPGWPVYAASLVLFLCALLSKSVTFSLPAAVLLLIWWKRGRVGGRDLVPLLPFFAAGIASGLLTLWMEVSHVGASGAEWSLTLLQRLLLAGRALWFYAWKIFWPAGQSFIYPRWEIDTGDWWQYLFPAGAVALLALCWAMRRRLGRGPLTALLFFAGTLSPALGFFNVYPMRYSWVADHFQYLAGVGLIALACGWAASLLARAGPGARRGGAVAGMILLAVLGTLSWRQGHAYADRETLWRDTLAQNPDAWIAHNNLAGLLTESGRYPEAIEHFTEALRLRPDDPDVHANLGLALAGTGDLDAAATAYRLALEAEPHRADLHARLAELEDERGDLEQTAAHYREALRIEPGNARRHTKLGVALAGLGRTEEAVAEYRQALHLDPTLADTHNNLGAALADMGRSAEAVTCYLEALRLDPDSADARVNLGNVRLGEGRLDEAVELYRDALSINPQLADAHNNLGFASALQGRIEEAVEHYQRALRFRPDFVSALNNLGNALAALGFLEPAAAAFSRAVELQPRSADIRYNLAMSLARLGLTGQAAEQLREVLRINPGDGQARAMLQRLEQGPPQGTDSTSGEPKKQGERQMTRTGATVWTILGIVAAILVMLGLIYGPELYRKGESIVAPIMELSRSEKVIAELNAELPFTVPEDGMASEERLLVFFEVRRQLTPHYEEYMAMEKKVERSQQEDLETVGQLLGTVTDVFDAQINTLRDQGMSPAEFRWYELEVYDGWLDKMELTELSNIQLANASELREMTNGDLDFVDQLQSTHGSSASLTAVRSRLTARLEQIDQPSAPDIDGISPENNALFWRYRETIAELKLDQHGEMHSRLRQGSGKGGVKININRPNKTEESR